MRKQVAQAVDGVLSSLLARPLRAARLPDATLRGPRHPVVAAQQTAQHAVGAAGADMAVLVQLADVGEVDAARRARGARCSHRPGCARAGLGANSSLP